jgi:hypothetical protein
MIPGVGSATTISGFLFFNGGGLNAYDPANANIPSNFNNSAGPVIAVPGTFGYVDAANQDTATFTNNTLIIEDQTFTSASPWQQDFIASDPNFFRNFTLVTDTLPGGVTFSLVGNSLSVNWNGTNSPGDGIVEFSFGATPLPAALPLFATGLGGLGLLGWRRKRKVQVA